MKLQQKLKTALDETRLLILGAQILLGFQLNGMFQDAFEQLAFGARLLDALAFLLMTVTIGLLIAPAMQHRIVEQGEASQRIQEATTTFAAAALLPLGVSLGLDLAIAFQRHYGTLIAAAAGVLVFALAMLFWFGLEWLRKRDNPSEKVMKRDDEGTPLHAKVEQMLTEARVLLPGAQALLGFQMAVMLSTSFDKIPAVSKIIHSCSLCCIALTIILLMAPAAFHRISYAGEDSEEFHRLGSGFVIVAALPLAAGITGDLYVAIAKAAESPPIAAVCAGVAAAVLIILWYVQPFLLRTARAN